MRSDIFIQTRNVEKKCVVTILMTHCKLNACNMVFALCFRIIYIVCTRLFTSGGGSDRINIRDFIRLKRRVIRFEMELIYNLYFY